MVEGPSVNRHHWTPRTEGGGDWSFLHVVCHKKIHSVLSDHQIARDFPDAETLRAHPDISAFIRWVRRRPPEYLDRVEKPRR